MADQSSMLQSLLGARDDLANQPQIDPMMMNPAVSEDGEPSKIFLPLEAFDEEPKKGGVVKMIGKISSLGTKIGIIVKEVKEGSESDLEQEY